MSEIRLRWIVADEVQLDRAFTRLAIDIEDFEQPLRYAGMVIYDETRHQFAKQGSPAWPAYSSAYAARKARKHPGKTMLRATDLLYDSLTDPDAMGAVYELTKDSLTIGSDVRAGKWNLGLIHHKGAPDANIPARPMLRLRARAKTRIVRGFQKYFIQVAKAQGLEVS